MAIAVLIYYRRRKRGKWRLRIRKPRS
ncbi:hypothetical protein [Mucilaginibacter sp. SP1R1]